MKRLLPAFFLPLCALLLCACMGTEVVTPAVPAPSEKPAQAPFGSGQPPVGNVPGGAVEVLPVEGSVAEGTPRPRPTPAPSLAPFPAAQTNEEGMYGVDEAVNMDTVDAFLGREDAVYIDLRMLQDPARFAGSGDAYLSATIKGFTVVPYPYICNLNGLPAAVSKTAYRGNTLFTATWNRDGSLQSVKANYAESEAVLSDLFPKDKAILLMSGDGFYAGAARALLVYLGYDGQKLYNIGGFQEYAGENRLEVLQATEAGEYYAFHRLDYRLIDFTRLHKAK